MSPGIVRFYFDSKAAMLVASLQFLAAEFEEQVLVPVSKLKSRPVAALELMVDLYLDPDIASPRKVSVWYAFWGEASSRQEYYDICGQKDESFAALVRELIGRLIDETPSRNSTPAASRSDSSVCWKCCGRISHSKPKTTSIVKPPSAVAWRTCVRFFRGNFRRCRCAPGEAPRAAAGSETIRGLGVRQCARICNGARRGCFKAPGRSRDTNRRFRGRATS